MRREQVYVIGTRGDARRMRWAVLATSADFALATARSYDFPANATVVLGTMPKSARTVMRAERSMLLELKTLFERALSRGVALPAFRAQSSSRSDNAEPTTDLQEATMAKKAKQAKGKQAKANGATKDAKYRVNKGADYAVREGTMSDSFVKALPKGVFTKAQAVSATQKAVKSEKRASLFFNYFKGKGVIATA